MKQESLRIENAEFFMSIICRGEISIKAYRLPSQGIERVARQIYL